MLAGFPDLAEDRPTRWRDGNKPVRDWGAPLAILAERPSFNRRNPSMISLVTCVFAAAMFPSSVPAQSTSDDPARQGSASFTGHTAPGPRVVSGQVNFTGSEATMSPRFYRSGNPGDPCSLFGTGAHQYTQVLMYTDGTGQLTANFDPQSCETAIYVTFHSAPLDPANICSAYLYAHGSSVAFSDTIPVPPNSPVYMVVSGVPTAPDLRCGPASYSITGANSEPAAPAVAAPALDGGSLALLALVIGLVGAGAVMRRK